MAELARSGFRPRGDLWFIAVADEEDGIADVGMRWLLEARPDIRPDLAINEGGGERLPLADGRVVQTVSVGEKGTYPARVVAVGEAGPRVDARRRRQRRTAPRRAAPPDRPGHADARRGHRTSTRMLEVLRRAVHRPRRRASARPPRCTRCWRTRSRRWAVRRWRRPSSSGSFKRNVMPARASVELDCRILPGTTEADVERAVRARLGADLPYELEWPEPLVAGSASSPTTALMDAISRVLVASGDDAELLPMLCTGFTDSVYLRAAGTPTALRLQPVPVHLGRGAGGGLPQRRRAGAHRRPAAVGGVPRGAGAGAVSASGASGSARSPPPGGGACGRLRALKNRAADDVRTTLGWVRVKLTSTRDSRRPARHGGPSAMTLRRYQ